MATILNPDELGNSHYITTNGVRLHCVTAGQGELIILLHGFPEHWYSWRHQIPILAKYGQVLAPDLRGYNLSEKPKGVRHYDIDILVRDVIGLLEHYNSKQIYLVGHDWGGAIAWWLAIYYPQYVKKLVVMNCPHPIAFEKVLRGLDQLVKSWYMFFFQLPWLPEKFVHGFNARNSARKIFRDSAGRPEAFSEIELDRLGDALDQPGALTPMINYYRAAFRRLMRFPPAPPVAAPTLLIWGEQDRFLVKRNTQNLEPYVNRLNIEYVPTAGHWVQQEEPDLVNQLLIEFLFNH